ncbi:hypothetical protein M201_gp49 [Haloarcula californiae tailed virus 2]|uniref:Uncharacterized protein n=1 Tax=Haloarcula californiae tailed virus 2 TaxID=1273747 RepID=R4TA92_9CAUD|nr:hypothetical protein M201_gp49 [Haloarcula californiae tailed virus 2]AGM11860.1 hypothetical protein HCTV2_56 [Haloarcula californiae tailed virus 2]
MNHTLVRILGAAWLLVATFGTTAAVLLGAAA